MGLELFGKDMFLPDEPRFTTPNKLDSKIRNRLYWGSENRALAENYSDALIYGVSLTSLIWGPLAAKEPTKAALINMEVFSANSLITNLVKISGGRERPYHHFGTRESEGPTDYASFFSGHSSVAFSQAVTNAMLLSHDYPQHEQLIWTSLLSTAALTAYFRIAGDMHYFSDVVVGASIGSLIAWYITDSQMKRFGLEGEEENDIVFKVSGNRSDFMFIVKIPLG